MWLSKIKSYFWIVVPLLAAKHTVLAAKHAVLAAKHAELAAKHVVLAAKHAVLAAKHSMLFAKDTKLAAKDTMLAAEHTTFLVNSLYLINLIIIIYYYYYYYYLLLFKYFYFTFENKTCLFEVIYQTSVFEAECELRLHPASLLPDDCSPNVIWGRICMNYNRNLTTAHLHQVLSSKSSKKM